VNELRIRHQIQPERRCSAFDRITKEDEHLYSCGRTPEFSFDAPGEVCENLCHYHARKRVVDLIDQMHADALRAWDEQTERLRELGKPCLICGVRAANHPWPYGVPESDAHEWTDDESDAAEWERDHK